MSRDALLYVADLSTRNGAWTQWHRSHRDGCDADLLFFAVLPNGMRSMEFASTLHDEAHSASQRGAPTKEPFPLGMAQE